MADRPLIDPEDMSAATTLPRSTTLTSLRSRHDDVARNVRRCEANVERLRSELGRPPRAAGRDPAGGAGDDQRGARPRRGARPPGADLARAAPRRVRVAGPRRRGAYACCSV